MTNINVIKLSNGENIICNVVNDSDKTIEIKSPLKMETISRVTKTGDIIAVPGKVLGAGVIEHSITIGAVSFSETAKVKIKNAGGTVMLIEKLVETNPDGKGVKIFVG